MSRRASRSDAVLKKDAEKSLSRTAKYIKGTIGTRHPLWVVGTPSLMVGAAAEGKQLATGALFGAGFSIQGHMLAGLARLRRNRVAARGFEQGRVNETIKANIELANDLIKGTRNEDGAPKKLAAGTGNMSIARSYLEKAVLASLRHDAADPWWSTAHELHPSTALEALQIIIDRENHAICDAEPQIIYVLVKACSQIRPDIADRIPFDLGLRHDRRNRRTGAAARSVALGTPVQQQFTIPHSSDPKFFDRRSVGDLMAIARSDITFSYNPHFDATLHLAYDDGMDMRDHFEMLIATDQPSAAIKVAIIGSADPELKQMAAEQLINMHPEDAKLLRDWWASERANLTIGQIDDWQAALTAVGVDPGRTLLPELRHRREIENLAMFERREVPTGLSFS